MGAVLTPLAAVPAAALRSLRWQHPARVGYRAARSALSWRPRPARAAAAASPRQPHPADSSASLAPPPIQRSSHRRRVLLPRVAAVSQPPGYSFGDDYCDPAVEEEDPGARSGYSYGDDLDSIVVDEDLRKVNRADARGGRRGSRLSWPPSLGSGAVPRIARAVWAMIAVGGVVWAAWSASRHVLFLGLNTTNLATTAAALADGQG